MKKTIPQRNHNSDVKYYNSHKEIISSKQKIYYQKNRDKILARDRKNYHKKKLDGTLKVYKKCPLKAKSRSLRHKYGITLKEYNVMFEAQSGCCAICTRHQSKFRLALHVDHCHSTGEIRGLLCKKCNKDLAVIEDNNYMINAAIYLKKHEELQAKKADHAKKLAEEGLKTP